ncbi:MAG: glycoside hydrolase family 16 protein [Lapillicoccus sp.]
MHLWRPGLLVRSRQPVRRTPLRLVTRPPSRWHAIRVIFGVTALGGMLVASPQVVTDSHDLGVSTTSAPSVAGAPWADEFNGPAGTPPSPSKWVHNVGGSGWGNQELENYTSSTANAHLDGQGNLAIVAAISTSDDCWYGACRYTSARLMTLSKFAQKFGHFETRMKVPDGAGLWPAFWALDTHVNDDTDPAYAENDIMELVGNDPTMIYSSLHASRSAGSKSMCVGYNLPRGAQYHSGFHVFAADWTATQVTFSVDGHRTATRTKASFGGAWTFGQPMFLILNLAVGGVWPGSPPASTVFPATLLVDYVRVTATPSLVKAAPVIPSNPPGGCDTAG